MPSRARNVALMQTDNKMEIAKGNFEDVAAMLNMDVTNRPLKRTSGWLNLPVTEKDSEQDPYLVNPFILSGYRVRWTAMECFCSICSLHNETWNIWSHLLPLLLLIIYGVHVMHVAPEGLSLLDQGMVATFFLGSGLALLGSVIYHTFSSMSAQVHDNLLCCDMGGCICLMMAFMIPCASFGFLCFQSVWNFYMIMNCITFVIGICISLFSNHPKYGWPLRIFGLPLLACTGISILVHIGLLATQDAWDTIWSNYQFTFYIAFGALGLYFLRFPEKYFPEFSRWSQLYSHALWHLAVVGCIAVGAVQIEKVSKYPFESGCA